MAHLAHPCQASLVNVDHLGRLWREAAVIAHVYGNSHNCKNTITKCNLKLARLFYSHANLCGITEREHATAASASIDSEI